MFAGTSAYGVPKISGFKKATVEDISGEVTLRKEASGADRKAALKDAIQGKDVVRTGKKSRAELEFSDKSIARLGSNTIFSFDPESRNMAISRGVALVHVPPGNGGARIATPAATAAISGDTLVIRATVMPDGTPATQFTRLSPQGGPTEGNVRITLNNNPNTSFPLDPGNVAIVPQNATSVAQCPRAEIDVATFAAKSPILRDLPPTAAQELNMVVGAQDQAFASGAAQRTEFALIGDRVVKADDSGNFVPGQAPPTESILPEGTVPDGTPDPFHLPTTPSDSVPQPGPLPGLPPPPPPMLPPPGAVSFLGIFNGTGVFTISGTIDTVLGTIGGSGPTPTTFAYINQNGVGHFGFDKLALAGSITVIGSNGLSLQTVNNSGGAGAALSLGGTTFTFDPATPRAVGLIVEGHGGDLSIAGTVVANDTLVNLVAPVSVGTGTTPPFSSGNITMSAGTGIDVSSLTVGKPGGAIILSAANNITAQSLTANGKSTSVGSSGGVVVITSGGTINLNGAINVNGGTSSDPGTAGGSGGFVTVLGSSIGTVNLISANGGTASGGSSIGGGGGGINLNGSGGALALVAGGNLSAIGGSGVDNGGKGGNINLVGSTVGVPDGATLMAAGGSGELAVGGAGGVASLNASSGISLTTRADVSIIDTAGGFGLVSGGTGGSITLNSPGLISVTDNSQGVGAPHTLDAGTGGTISAPQAPITPAGSGFSTNP